MADNTPIVYYQPGCPYAARLRTQLTVARIPHRSVRFRDERRGPARSGPITRMDSSSRRPW
jgi:hypothetical protein